MLNHRGKLVNIISYNKRTLKMSRKGQAFTQEISKQCVWCVLFMCYAACLCVHSSQQYFAVSSADRGRLP